MKRIALYVALSLLLAACAGDGVLKIKDPGPVPATTSTTVIDYGAMGLKGVTNRTATSLAIGPGNAQLSGTVAGPDGAVAGATVRVERLIGNNAARTDLVSAADGTWAVPSVLGGRYRVRAWRTPDLAQTKPELFFLQSSEKRAVALRLDKFVGAAVTPSMAPTPPPYNRPVNLFVLVSQRTVDAAGVVQSSPMIGVSVDLGGSGYVIETFNPVTTDANGVAEWRLRCSSYAEPSLSVNVGGSGVFPLAIPRCIDPDAPVTTIPASSTTSRRTARTTTTTRR